LKADRESLEASDQRLGEECNRHDQDGEKKNGEQDGRQSALPLSSFCSLQYAG